MAETITVGQLIQALNEVKNKDMPVYIVEQKKEMSKNGNGQAIYKVKNKYRITSGGQTLTTFVLAFCKDSKVPQFLERRDVGGKKINQEVMKVCRQIKFSSFNNYIPYRMTYLIRLYLQAEMKEDFYNAESFADVIIDILRRHTEDNNIIKNYNFIYEVAKTIKDNDIRKIKIDDLNGDVHNYQKDLLCGLLSDRQIKSLLSLLKKCIIHLVYKSKNKE